jgi:hypothetical protein
MLQFAMLSGERSSVPFRKISQIFAEVLSYGVVRKILTVTGIGHTFAVDPDMVETLVRQGFHRTLRARPLRNVVDQFPQERAMGPLLKQPEFQPSPLAEDDHLPCR